MLAPIRMPPAILKKIQDDVAAVLKTPAIAERMATEASEPGAISAEAFGAMLKHEIAKWGKVVRQVGIKPE